MRAFQNAMAKRSHISSLKNFFKVWHSFISFVRNCACVQWIFNSFKKTFNMYVLSTMYGGFALRGRLKLKKKVRRKLGFSIYRKCALRRHKSHFLLFFLVNYLIQYASSSTLFAYYTRKYFTLFALSLFVLLRAFFFVCSLACSISHLLCLLLFAFKCLLKSI